MSKNFKPLEDHAIQDWIPRPALQDYLGLKNTSMSQFAKKYGIRTSKIGRLKFYCLSDVLNLLENNAQFN